MTDINSFLIQELQISVFLSSLHHLSNFLHVLDFYFTMYDLTRLENNKEVAAGLNDYSDYMIEMNSVIYVKECCYKIIYVCPRKSTGNYTVVRDGQAIKVESLDFDKTAVIVVEVDTKKWFPDGDQISFTIQFQCELKRENWDASTFVNISYDTRDPQ